MVVFALWPVQDHRSLLVWFGAIVGVGIVRTGACLVFIRQWPIDDASLPRWTASLSILAFLQALIWGLSVVFIWPQATEYRAFLMAALAGVIAAGGVMLAVHRRSFAIYCLPIAVPALYQLVSTGGRVEVFLSGLVLLYSVLLIVTVNRLGRSFVHSLLVRLQMESLSRTDPLTHIANRRGFDEYIDGIWQNAIRSRQSIGLIIADIDHFKSYNDRYGHPQGDEALIQLASILSEAAIRATDLCARVGGEEFAVLLPSTDEEGTLKIAEQIQQKLVSEAIPHPASPVGHLTVSLGYGAIQPNRDSDIESFYASVDRALYEAKRRGRDRIERASETVSV